ncbi:hypothetical protein MACJ_001698 [Theileria orientalis]|uniref:Signal recognition particle receptor subunit beta n=1 Tax=Theileria orientalis TaxID=68886 RepID=A0A976M938_THEOR|nr:hypothetical protein MACJ_001698 [Theileria orientalis]
MFRKCTRTLIVRYYSIPPKNINISSNNPSINNLNTKGDTNTNFDPKQVPKLDVRGFERQNIRRLRPFIKFLLFQSIPIFFLMFLYKYLENKKLDSLSVAVDQDFIPHILRVIKGSKSFLLLEKDLVFIDITAIDSNFPGFDGNIRDLSLEKLLNYISKELDFIGVKFKLNTSYLNLVNSRVRVLSYNPERYSYIILEGVLSAPAKNSHREDNNAADSSNYTTTTTASNAKNTSDDRSKTPKNTGNHSSTSGLANSSDKVLFDLFVDKVTVKFTNSLLSSVTNTRVTTGGLSKGSNRHVYGILLAVLAAVMLLGFVLKRRSKKSSTIVIMGPVNSGKTCLLYKLVNGCFPKTVSSQGVNVASLTAGIARQINSTAVTGRAVDNDADTSGKSNSNVSNHGTTGTGSGSTSGSSVTLVDVSGNEDISLHMNHINNCRKFILMFDSTNRKSYKLLVNVLLQLITLTYSSKPKGAGNTSSKGKSAVGAGSGRSILLVGNKNDMFNCKNVNEMNKIILLELELLLQNYFVNKSSLNNPGVDVNLNEYLSSLKNMTSLSDIKGFEMKLVSYSVKNGDLEEIKEYIAS